jgi:arylsulfatase A-like enzyme
MDASVFGHTQASGEVFSSLMSARFPHFTPIGDLYFFKLSSKIIDHLAVSLGIWSLTDQNPLEPPFSEARTLVRSRDPLRPMFLWVHVLRPHSPYSAPAPFLGEFNPSPRMRTRFNSTPNSQFSDPKNSDELLAQYAGRYDESVRYFDSSIGRFIDWLKERGLFDKSLLIVSSDHGESFSHRYAIHGGPMLYDDIIHVPLLIKEPGQTEGRRVDALTEQVDLMPTILDLVGVPAARPPEGRSLKGAMRGQRVNGPVFSMDFEQNSRFEKLTNGSVAMIEGRWKYVRYLGQVHVPLVPVLTDSLYDLEADPGETISLIGPQGIVAARMRAAIDRQVALHDKPAQ